MRSSRHSSERGSGRAVVHGRTISTLVAAVLFTSAVFGCVGPSWSLKSEPTSPPPAAPASLTVVRAGQLTESRHPPLAVLAVRIARSDLDLDAAQEPEIDDLIRKTNAAMRPIDEARILFLNTLARAVAEDHYSPTIVAIASERLVHAMESALPKLESALTDLHVALSPRQRIALVQILELRIPSWASTWRLPPTAKAEQFKWIEWLADDHEPLNEQALRGMREDAIATVRQWCSQTAERVMQALPTLNAAQRRALSLELQLDPDA